MGVLYVENILQDTKKHQICINNSVALMALKDEEHDLIIIYISLKVMCDMHMLYKTGTVCLRVSDPYFISDRIYFCTVRTHLCRVLMAELVLILNQVLSLCPIPPLLRGGYM